MPAPSCSASTAARTRGGAIALVEQGRHEAAVVAPRRVGVDRGQGVEVEPAEGPHEGPHVGQRVFAGAVHDRRHEVGEHGVGAIPPQALEELERLLGVDRGVAVREVVVADDRREPPAQLGAVAPGLDGAEHQRLRRLHRLALDRGAERGGRVGREPAERWRQRVHRSAALGLGDPGDRLHDRQRPLVTLVELDHRQAVDGGGDGVAPTELGPRRSVVDRLPHQLAGVGVGAQQAHHVARHLPDALVHDPVAQARHQARPLGARVGAAELDAQRAVGAHLDGVGAHALLAEHALAGRHVELPVVPRAGQQVAGELALAQPVALVRARLVEGVHAGARAHEQQAPVALAVGHLDQLHRRRLEVGQGHVQLHAHDATTSTELDVKA